MDRIISITRNSNWMLVTVTVTVTFWHVHVHGELF
jgi:hypothetical protein